MKNIMIILQKQINDTLKNKTILIQFLMFPVMTFIMEKTVKMEGMPPHFFTNLFAVMFVGMAPLTSMASIISEEKEKNTLRVLLLSNVKPWEYLLGVGVYIWMICMAGAAVIGLSGGYEGEILAKFLLIMSIGLIVSILVGASIGTFSKNQMMATSLTVPVMMVCAFVPMLSMFNESIRSIGKFLYSQQLQEIFLTLADWKVSAETIIILSVNMAVAVVLFTFSYRKNKFVTV